MIKKYAVLLMLGAWIFVAPLYAQEGKNAPKAPQSSEEFHHFLDTLVINPDLERYAKQAAEEAQRAQKHQADAQVHTVWTCAFCGEPILHDHQRCSNHRDNPFDVCTHKDLNWGTPLHKGEYRDREKSRYQVPFEPAQVTVSQKTVWTCAFCGEPILHDHQKCSNHRDNPFSVCTHKDLNWGTPLHKGEHREGREKSTYNVPYEPSQVEVARPVSSQPAASVSSKENK